MTVKHDTNSYGCWCVPEVYLPCNECQRPGHVGRERAGGCWACASSRFPGLILAPLPLSDEETYVVIHHDVLAP